MKKIRRILALGGVVLLVCMYAATLFLAVADSTDTMAFFKASILTTILIPVLIWTYSFVYRMIRPGGEEVPEDAPEDAGSEDLAAGNRAEDDSAEN